MKILSLTNTPLDPSLGSGKTVLAWTHGLRELGHDVDVWSPEVFYHPWPRDTARRLKIRIDTLGLAARIMTGNYDLVEFYGAEFSLLINKLSATARKRRPLLVAHTNGLELLANERIRNSEEYVQKSPLKALVTKYIQNTIEKIDTMAFSKVDGFAAICDADKNFIVREKVQHQNRCIVVEPGIDEVFLNAPWQRDKKQWIVSFASWTPRKDPETLIHVVTELFTQIPELEFHVLGASSSKTEILNSFPESLRSRIVVYPRLSQEDIVEVLSQAKVLLFPSLYEGFGMATTEAMACGCAVVVTPTGFGEAIRNGVDGFVCNFQDVETMASRCTAVLADEDLRHRCITVARGRVIGLDWSAQVRKLEAHYTSWLQIL